jgi:hypothetical protein
MLLCKISQEIWYSNLVSCLFVPSQYMSNANSNLRLKISFLSDCFFCCQGAAGIY